MRSGEHAANRTEACGGSGPATAAGIAVDNLSCARCVAKPAGKPGACGLLDVSRRLRCSGDGTRTKRGPPSAAQIMGPSPGCVVRDTATDVSGAGIDDDAAGPAGGAAGCGAVAAGGGGPAVACRALAGGGQRRMANSCTFLCSDCSCSCSRAQHSASAASERPLTVSLLVRLSPMRVGNSGAPVRFIARGRSWTAPVRD
mmetsp:Transcript_89898/g.284577  ORF Transcript_89898/g.284577 Transcript_89898/m.284577 type:complete len:200 (+) Transcript_89898:983-1582(+)